MIVAIHQPNFFPWLGYFSKIKTCDKFIVLDDVQLPKTGGTWSNRVKILINGEGKWMTAPIIRNYHGVRKINEVTFDGQTKWREKILKTIESSYRRCSFYDETMSMIEPLLFHKDDNVAAYNLHAIQTIASALGIEEKKFVLSSEFPNEYASNDLLIYLTKMVGGDVYMCGGGADTYQDESAYREAGVTLRYQNFVHPQYSQRGSKNFIPGLSIIDSFMNIGITGTREILPS